MSPVRGEVWKADLGMAAKGERDVIVLSRNDPDAPRALIIYVPITTKNRDSRYEVELPRLPFLKERSWANAQGVASLGKHRFISKSGDLPPDALKKVEGALLYAIGLTN
jgi:mRNA interferase MazF